ncbi:MAG: hypothetical protein JWO90_2038, partial [Solirubrobacterales bacterium]|nr:hypothetical protein [Solirubrobacterales bacterium]
ARGIAGRTAARRRPDPALLEALRALVLTRLLVVAAGLVALAWVGERPGAGAGFDPERMTVGLGSVGDALVASAARWDAVWFLTIAERGYGLDGARPAFFPLYPLLVRGAGTLVGSPVVGGVLVSLACFGVALGLLHRLTALELGEPAARRAVWLTAAFPMAWVFSAVYSEALFLALSVGCVLAARTDRWAWAGALGLLAAATRSAGLVLLVPLLVLLWEHRGAGLWRRAGWVALVPAGTAAFCAWLWWDGAGARAPFDAQETWARELSVPFAAVWEGTVAAWEGARQLLSGAREPVLFTPAGGDPFEVAQQNLVLWAFLALGLVALVGTARRLPPAYPAYALAALALPLSTPVAAQPLMSLPRFLAVLFPLAMWGGARLAGRGRAAHAVVGAVWLAGLAVSTGQVATWRWVA